MRINLPSFSFLLFGPFKVRQASAYHLQHAPSSYLSYFPTDIFPPGEEEYCLQKKKT